MADQLALIPALELASEPSTILDGNVHVGFAIGLTAGSKASALVVPDVTGVTTGTSPVFLAKPITLEFVKIKNYLANKAADAKTQLDTLEKKPELKRFLESTSVSINSFYYKGAAKAEDGIVLFQIALNFTKADADKDKDDKKTGSTGGIIGALTGDKDLSELFDITGMSVRVLRCKGDENVKILQAYADSLKD